MSAIRHTFIQCDGLILELDSRKLPFPISCKETFGHPTEQRKFEHIREVAKTEGWTYHKCGDGTAKDFCPSCRPKRRVRKGNNGNTRKGAKK